MHDKPSLFGSRYLGRNGCQEDYEKLKIASKQKPISGSDNILWTVTLHCGPSSFEKKKNNLFTLIIEM